MPFPWIRYSKQKISYSQKSLLNMQFPIFRCLWKNICRPCHFWCLATKNPLFEKIKVWYDISHNWLLQQKSLYEKINGGYALSQNWMTHKNKISSEINCRHCHFTLSDVLLPKIHFLKKIIAGFAIFQNWVPHKHFLKNLMQAMQFPRIEWLKTKSTFLKE